LSDFLERNRTGNFKVSGARAAAVTSDTLQVLRSQCLAVMRQYAPLGHVKRTVNDAWREWAL